MSSQRRALRSNRGCGACEAGRRWGWDGVFLEDYIGYQGMGIPTFDPWIELASIASATTAIKLGIQVAALPRRRPWKLAGEAVTLDHLSGGRLILGVGLGDVSTDPGFNAVGEPTDVQTRAELLDESLDIIAGLWTAEPFPMREDIFAFAI
jgi:alkanesulfonate monooxygenase SsuD/methylene tetrahydromethanopterin reductase-like flavin-dependent oxidoreductase (luciferase family)